MRTFRLFLILFPLAYSVLNLQSFINWKVSEGAAQVSAYAAVLTAVCGVFANLGEIKPLSRTARTWIGFYIIYFTLGILASIRLDWYEYVLKSLISPIYFVVFLFFLRIPENRQVFHKALTILFVISSLILIAFYHMGFEMGIHGRPEWGVDRAQGVFGDANNSCLIAILTYVLLAMVPNPRTKLKRVLRLGLMAMTIYSILITYSTTGFLVFFIVFPLVHYKFFTRQRILLAPLVVIPAYLFLINLDTMAQSWNLNIRQYSKIENITNLLKLNFGEVSSSGRGELANQVFEHIYENPFLGNGIWFGSHIRGHNTYLVTWADAGVFALVALLVVLGIHFAKAMSLKSDVRYFSLSFLLTFGIFMISLQTVINQPYIMAILAYLGYVIDTKTIYNDPSTTSYDPQRI